MRLLQPDNDRNRLNRRCKSDSWVNVMIGLPSDILKPGLKALYYSGAHHLLAPLSRGLGIIFMLHRVSPITPDEFAPNAGLSVTPDYLDSVLLTVQEAELDIVTLDEACDRLEAGDPDRRFACFTLDDGYKDNLVHALPVFKRHNAPFTVYVPSDFPDGKGELWWVALEEVIAQNEQVTSPWESNAERISTATANEKNAAFDRLYAGLRKANEDTQRNMIRQLCKSHGLDLNALCRDLIMTWDEVRRLAAEPLATIGAHTVAHYAVAKLSDERTRQEMKDGADRLAKELGQWPAHLSFPYGDPESAGPRDFAIAAELGFKTAVTTRKGLLFPEHSQHLTALPRVSLNGAYQSEVFTKLYLSGAPFALWNRFRRVDAA